MIAIVSMAYLDTYNTSDGQTGQKRKFEQLTGAPAINVHYTQASPEYLARLGARAVFICGFGYGWNEVRVPDLYPISDFLHTTDIPVYAACGGHQLLGFVFNNDLRKVKRLQDEPMRKLRGAEPDYGYSARVAGHYTATGYQVVDIVKRDPIFAGLRKRFRVRQAHYCEVKKLPRGFELLATSPECRIEMMKHTGRPIYGAQFHAESWQEPWLDGQKIMANFFRMAGLMK
jgi:GMP synthase (glutamine-hydrolysing)